MLDYEKLIETISEIVENEKIYKNGLMLLYTLPEKRHLQMNQHLFFKSNPADAKFIATDVFDLDVNGITIKFIKEGTELKFEYKKEND